MARPRLGTIDRIFSETGPEIDTRTRQASLEPTFTDEQVAESLHKSVRWLRNFVAKTPELDVMRAGRTLLFTARDVERLKAALRSGSTPPHRSTLRYVRAVNSAQDEVRELLRTARQQRKTQNSGQSISKRRP